MMKLGILVIAILSVTGAQAAVKDCDFVSREKLTQVFSSFDSKVVGLANCRDAFPELNAYYVGKFETLDEATVRKFVTDVAMTVDGTANKSFVKWQSKQSLDRRQLIIETQSPPNASRPHVDLMSHYSFINKAADGTYLVFVTTLDPESFLRNKRALEASNRLLSSGGRFAASVSNANSK